MDEGATMTLRAASCFSGIGAPEVAMPHWDWLWCAEIEKFPSAVMAARHPDSVNLGDVTADDFMQRASSFGQIDVLAGGPPCQDFSVAGLRAGMAGDRGNLSLRFLEIAHAIRPRNLLVENVPGWLSMPDNAFGSFLAGLVGGDDALIPCVKPMAGRSNAGWSWRKAGLVWRVIDGGNGIPVIIDNPEDYEPHEVEHVHLDARHIPKWPSVGMVAGPRGRAAWRVFDAQYFGLAQRRSRVFIVADFGNGADPAQVLFERRGMFGNTPPSRKARKDLAGTIAARTKGGGGLGTDFDLDGGLTVDVADTLKGEGFDASEDGTGRGTPLVPVCYDTTHITSPGNWSNPQPSDPCHPLTATAHVPLLTEPMYGVDSSHGTCSGEGILGTLTADSPSGGGCPLPAIAYTLEARSEVQAVGFAQNQRDEVRLMDVAGALASDAGMKQQTYVNQAWSVRRLTPVECARLQGFDDDYLDIIFRGKPAADGNKYKALGNSWAVPNGRWIMERIERFMP